MIGVLRTLLIIVIFYYLFKWVARIFTARAFKKYGHQASQNKDSKNRKEGDITILNRGKRPTGDDQKLGDFVDYEEIDQ